MGLSLVKTVDGCLWVLAGQGLGIVPGEPCAWACLLSFFCGLCLILSDAVQLGNRSSHTNRRKETSGNINGLPLLVWSTNPLCLVDWMYLRMTRGTPLLLYFAALLALRRRYWLVKTFAFSSLNKFMKIFFGVAGRLWKSTPSLKSSTKSPPFSPWTYYALVHFANVYLDSGRLQRYLEFEPGKHVVYWITVCVYLGVCVKKVAAARDKLFNMIFLHCGEAGWASFFGLWFVLWNAYQMFSKD